MNVVLLQGILSSDPVCRTLASGSTLWSMELTTVVDGVTQSVPVAWFDPPTAPVYVTGDALLVHGTVRRRFFRNAGLTQARTEVVAAEVVAVSRRKQARGVVAKVAAALSTAA